MRGADRQSSRNARPKDLSPLALTYCIAVLLLNFMLRGSLGFGGALGRPLLGLVLPVKVLAPAWSLVGIISSAIIGHGRQHVDRRQFLGLLPGCPRHPRRVARHRAPRAGTGRLHHPPLRGLLVLDDYRPAGKKPPVPPKVLRPLASFLSGTVGTIFGSMASIFFAMYVDAGGASKHVARATVSAVLITLSFARTIGYAAVGELTIDSLILSAAALPAMASGYLSVIGFIRG